MNNVIIVIITKALFTQDVQAHLHANPLMLLASCVNTPIDQNVFYYLHMPVARCSVRCVNWAQTEINLRPSQDRGACMHFFFFFFFSSFFVMRPVGTLQTAPSLPVEFFFLLSPNNLLQCNAFLIQIPVFSNFLKSHAEILMSPKGPAAKTLIEYKHCAGVELF